MKINQGEQYDPRVKRHGQQKTGVGVQFEGVIEAMDRDNLNQVQLDELGVVAEFQ